MQLDLERSVLARELSGLILFRELDVDVKLFTGLVADDLILEAGDELAGAERQGEVLALAALKRGAVDEALKVDIRDIAVFSLTLTGQDTGIALAHTVDLGVNSAVFHSFDRFDSL